jgi:CRISPR-associated endonuclease Csn1
VATCNIKGTDKVVSLIEENILIHHIAQDKALTPARRKERIHGKVIKILDENGKLTPKIINTGDSIRGNIHLQSWYGAIKLPLFDKDGKPMRDEQGNFIYDEKQPVRYVKRVSLDELANAKKLDWRKLEEVMVDKHLFNMMYSQYPNLSFKEACREGLYMFDKQGNRINQIRHVRCYAPTNAHIVPIKAQTYLSDKSYKQDFLADVGDMYAMVRYENEKGKALYKTYSLYEISKSGIMEIPAQYVEKGTDWNLKHILKKGMKVLLFEHDRKELTSLSKAQYSKRLYIIQGFESDKRITLLHHLCAKQDVPREPIQTFEALPEKIRCSINQINYLVEGVDFEQTVNGIELK